MRYKVQSVTPSLINGVSVASALPFVDEFSSILSGVSNLLFWGLIAVFVLMLVGVALVAFNYLILGKLGGIERVASLGAFS